MWWSYSDSVGVRLSWKSCLMRMSTSEVQNNFAKTKLQSALGMAASSANLQAFSNTYRNVNDNGLVLKTLNYLKNCIVSFYISDPGAVLCIQVCIDPAAAPHGITS